MSFTAAHCFNPSDLPVPSSVVLTSNQQFTGSKLNLRWAFAIEFDTAALASSSAAMAAGKVPRIVFLNASSVCQKEHVIDALRTLVRRCLAADQQGYTLSLQLHSIVLPTPNKNPDATCFASVACAGYKSCTPSRRMSDLVWDNFGSAMFDYSLHIDQNFEHRYCVTA